MVMKEFSFGDGVEKSGGAGGSIGCLRGWKRLALKSGTPVRWSLAFALIALSLQAQEANQLEKFNEQLKQIQERFEKEQRELRESFERLVHEQQAQIDALKKQIEASKTNLAPVVAQPTAPVTAEQRLGTTTATPPAAATERWTPTSPIRCGSAQNYINLSFDALVAAGTSTADDIEKLQLGGHDPKQRGFTVQNLETVFEGKVDPYFRGQANVVLQIDPHGETTIEAE